MSFGSCSRWTLGDSTTRQYRRHLYCLQVYIIHRRDEFRASKIMQNRALANPKIEVLWSTVAEEAYGNEKGMLGGLKIRSLKDDTVSISALSSHH